MTRPTPADAPPQRLADKHAEREAKLAKALRDNLRRRKATPQDAPKAEE